MARPRNPKRDEAFQMWFERKGQMLLKDIAEQFDLSDSQIRKWKNQDKWDDYLKGNVTKRSRGAPAGNNNGKGHGARVGVIRMAKKVPSIEICYSKGGGVRYGVA